MIRVRQVQYCVAQKNHQLFVFSMESSGEWLVSRLFHHAFPHPLPKLCLCGPELLPVTTDHERRLSLLLFLLVFVFLDRHVSLNTQIPLHGNSLRRRSIYEFG